MKQKKSASILKKFLIFNLTVFSVLGLLTIIYLEAIQPTLVKERSDNHKIVINNTKDNLERLNIKYTPQKWSKLETQLANSSKSEISTFCDSVGADTIKDACEIVKKNVIVPAVKSDTNALVTESIDKNTANIPSAFVESIKQDVQISRGIKREKDNIENFESKSAMIVTEQNSQIFEKKITIWKQHEILLVGKVDGISKDENECDVIIEVKERRNRLFNALVDY